MKRKARKEHSRLPWIIQISSESDDCIYKVLYKGYDLEVAKKILRGLWSLSSNPRYACIEDENSEELFRFVQK